MAVTVEIAEIIEKQKFGAFQMGIVALCGCVQFLDGFDTQALAYAAPTLRAAWHLSPAALGPVFGFGAFGTGIGSVVLSPLADMFGRKTVMIASVILFGLFTLATVFLQSVDQLLILRPLTGFGLGAALPLTYVVANEFAPARIRARMVAIMATGFAIGAAFGGLLQVEMAPAFGWQGIFLAGGIVPLLVAGALALFLPESVRYLVTRGGHGKEIAATLRRIEPAGHFTPDMNFVLRAEPKKPGVRVMQLFREGRAVMSVLLWLTYLVTLAMLNTLNNWLPVALNDAGLPVSQAVRVTTLFQFGGIAGVLALGTLADKFGFHRVLILGFIFLAVFVAMTGSVGTSLPALAFAVAGTGLCLVGANNTLNAFATTLYPTDIRSTGISWASSFGRFVGGFGPIIGGILLAKLPLQTVFFVFACPALVGALSVLGLLRNHRADPPEEPARAPYFPRP